VSGNGFNANLKNIKYLQFDDKTLDLGNAGITAPRMTSLLLDGSGRIIIPGTGAYNIIGNTVPTNSPDPFSILQVTADAHDLSQDNISFVKTLDLNNQQVTLRVDQYKGFAQFMNASNGVILSNSGTIASNSAISNYQLAANDIINLMPSAAPVTVTTISTGDVINVNAANLLAGSTFICQASTIINLSGVANEYTVKVSANGTTVTDNVSGRDGSFTYSGSASLVYSSSPVPLNPITLSGATTSQTLVQGEHFEFNIGAGSGNGIFSNIQGQKFTYSATQLDGQALPAWIKFGDILEIRYRMGQYFPEQYRVVLEISLF